MKKAIPPTAKAYSEQLMKEVNEDRPAHRKEPFDGNSGGHKRFDNRPGKRHVP